MKEYDAIHDWYVAARSSEMGVADVAAVVRGLPRRAARPDDAQ